MLRSNTHDNKYLQNTWNKYGDLDFSIEVLCICENKNEVLEKEQYYLDFYESYNLKKGFNINPISSETPKLNKNQIDKRSESIRKSNKIRFSRYHLWKNGNLNDDDLSIKEKLHFNTLKNRIPWNKGLKMNDELKSKLSISAKNRKCTVEGNLKRRIKTRNKLPNVYVYSKDLEYIGTWNSSKDLQEESLNHDFCLKKYMILRNENGRNGNDPYFLSTFNINKSCTKDIIYKGLYFKHEPLHQVTDVEKMEEFGESPSLMDNTEPSITNEQLSSNEGVETNS
jgi:hypothetical protein